MRINLERKIIKILIVKNTQYEPEAVHDTFDKLSTHSNIVSLIGV